MKSKNKKREITTVTINDNFTSRVMIIVTNIMLGLIIGILSYFSLSLLTPKGSDKSTHFENSPTQNCNRIVNIYQKRIIKMRCYIETADGNTREINCEDAHLYSIGECFVCKTVCNP